MHANENINVNNLYLQRRRLNVEDEDQKLFNSDEEEKLIVEEEKEEAEALVMRNEPRLI